MKVNEIKLELKLELKLVSTTMLFLRLLGAYSVPSKCLVIA